MSLKKTIIKIIILILAIFTVVTTLSTVSTIIEYKLSLTQMENSDSLWIINQLYTNLIEPLVTAITVVIVCFIGLSIATDIYKYIKIKVNKKENSDED